ncbi:MAG: hypothetical protein Q9157_000021 [Trypethelium eluteriae]
MPLHLGVSGHHRSPATKAGQAAIREARKMLLERVRDDWEYEPWPLHCRLEPCQYEDPNRHSYKSSPLEWTERLFNTSSPSESDAEDDENHRNGTDNDFKFESPDTVGAALANRRASRKRKRQAALEEEKSWNEGLAIFEARRDAWTGARSGIHDSAIASNLILSSPSSTGSPESPGSPSQIPSSSPSNVLSNHEPSADGKNRLIFNPADPCTFHLPVRPQYSKNVYWQPTLVPLVEPILPPDHPIRATINPSSYPQIYTQVVINSRSPSVPINLVDMIKACVQGWIEDGEWPPKGGVLEPSIAKRRKQGGDGLGHGNLRKGMEGVKRILRISGVSSTGAEAVGG